MWGPVPVEQPLLAAVLRAGEGARLAGQQALALYGLEGASLSGAPVVIVPPSRVVRGVAFQVRRGGVDVADRATVRGVPTLRVERAVIELARDASDKRIRQAVDSGRWLGRLRVERLVRRAGELGSHPGARRLLRLYADGTFTPESEGERDHTAQRDVHADRRRELAIRAAGTEVVRVTKEMIRAEAALTRARIDGIRRRRAAPATA